MIDHTSLGVRDFDRAVAFYAAALAPLGFALQRLRSDEAAFGTTRDWGFFLYPVLTGGGIVGEKTHVAFRAPSREAVVAFNRIGTELGGAQLRPVGPRPDIDPDYFGVSLTDPDGHTLEAVFWDRS